MNFWKTKLKIKNLEIPRIMPAPMDGVIDSPLRQMIREFSKNELLFMEMRHVGGIANEKKNQSLTYEKNEHPLCFQFSANTLNYIEKAIERVLTKDNKISPRSHPFDSAENGSTQGERRPFEMLNFNSCCPAKTVIGSGGGSALMAKPELLKEILLLFKKNIPDEMPFTLKIRAGYKEKNGFEIAMLAQELGLDAVIIHPRTQPQMFSGDLDLEMVKKIKKELSIPIIYSGNLIAFENLKNVYEETGVDGFMVGRALIGSPWKLEEIKSQMNNVDFNLTLEETINIAIKHFNLSLKHHGPSGFFNFKKHLSGYIKSVKNASEIRHKLISINDPVEFETELKKITLEKNDN